MIDEQEKVVLVDLQDQEIGFAPKLDAHRRGQLHRAISVCIIDDQGRMLLQQRARDKYHSGGLWTNACCTHPRRGEAVNAAAERRLNEELGVSCSLAWVLRTHYRASVGDLIENEVVHLFHGFYTGEIRPDRREVEAFAWTSRDALIRDIAERPQDYTFWFKYYVESFADRLFFGAAA